VSAMLPTAGAGQRSDTLRSLLLHTVHAHPERPAITYRCRSRAAPCSGDDRCRGPGGRPFPARTSEPHLPVIELDIAVPLPGPPLGANSKPFHPALLRARLSRLPVRPPGDSLLYLQRTGTSGPARVIEVSERAMLASVQAVRGETIHPFPVPVVPADRAHL